MDDLTNINEDNLGGLNVLKFAPRHFFSSLDPSALAFRPNCDWIKVALTSETANIDQETGEDASGQLVNVSINAQLPKIRKAIEANIRKYVNQSCVVWCRDQNGIEQVTGMFPGELILQENSTSGTAVTDINGYKLSFKGTQTHKAYILNP